MSPAASASEPGVGGSPCGGCCRVVLPPALSPREVAAWWHTRREPVGAELPGECAGCQGRSATACPRTPLGRAGSLRPANPQNQEGRCPKVCVHSVGAASASQKPKVAGSAAGRRAFAIGSLSPSSDQGPQSCRKRAQWG